MSIRDRFSKYLEGYEFDDDTGIETEPIGDSIRRSLQDACRETSGSMNTYQIHTDGTESVGPEGVYLVWSGSSMAGVSEHANLEDALHDFAIDCEYRIPWTIEGPAGEVPEAQINAWVSAYERRLSASRTASMNGMAGRVWHAIEVRRLNCRDVAEIDQFDDLGDAIAEMGRLNLPGRTRIVMKVWDGQHWQFERVVIDWAPTVMEHAA